MIRHSLMLYEHEVVKLDKGLKKRERRAKAKKSSSSPRGASSAGRGRSCPSRGSTYILCQRKKDAPQRLVFRVTRRRLSNGARNSNGNRDSVPATATARNSRW